MFDECQTFVAPIQSWRCLQIASIFQQQSSPSWRFALTAGKCWPTSLVTCLIKGIPCLFTVYSSIICTAPCMPSKSNEMDCIFHLDWFNLCNLQQSNNEGDAGRDNVALLEEIGNELILHYDLLGERYVFIKTRMQWAHLPTFPYIFPCTLFLIVSCKQSLSFQVACNYEQRNS